MSREEIPSSCDYTKQTAFLVRRKTVKVGIFQLSFLVHHVTDVLVDSRE